MNKFKVVYHGMPLKPSINGVLLNWQNLMEYILANKNEYLEFNGWRFHHDYGIMYLLDKKYWNYYLPPTGIRNKVIVDGGGGCGETAKFFIEHGASKVIVMESNPLCEPYLKYNSKLHPELEYHIGKFDFLKIYTKNYDLLKLDIEGYEIELLPWLNHLESLNKDIILESHCNYITDKFLERGFKLVKDFNRNKDIYGGVVRLCRWKKFQDYNCSWCQKVIRPDEQPDWKERMEKCKSCIRDEDYIREYNHGLGD